MAETAENVEIAELRKAADPKDPTQPLCYVKSLRLYIRCQHCLNENTITTCNEGFCSTDTCNGGMCYECMGEFRGGALSGFKHAESEQRIATRRAVNLDAWHAIRAEAENGENSA